MKFSRTQTVCAAMLIGVVGAGCTQHHYYGASPMCQAPVGGGSVINTPIVAGAYCDVPGTAGTPVVVQTNPGKAKTVVTNRRPPTVITSQASGGSGSDNWRNSRDSGGATTRMSGTLEDDTISR